MLCTGFSTRLLSHALLLFYSVLQDHFQSTSTCTFRLMGWLSNSGISFLHESLKTNESPRRTRRSYVGHAPCPTLALYQGALLAQALPAALYNRQMYLFSLLGASYILILNKPRYYRSSGMSLYENVLYR